LEEKMISEEYSDTEPVAERYGFSEFFRVKNWEEFQHYKDRSPPWIKLWNGLLDDYEFCELSDTSKAHLMLIWLLASRCDNKLRVDAEWVGKRINAQSPVDLNELLDAGFIILGENKSASRSEDRRSRHIPQETKKAVQARDGGTCQKCGSKEHIEYVHIVPVSKGGSSELDNVQLLCRSCSRQKRVRSESHVAAEQVATPSVEREEESRGEGEERERRGEKMGADAPAFSGDFIKSVSHKNLDEWLKSFTTFTRESMLAELAVIDVYYSSLDRVPTGKWFFRTANWLKKTHVRALEEKDDMVKLPNGTMATKEQAAALRGIL
jgi:hypothetical protein